MNQFWTALAILLTLDAVGALCGTIWIAFALDVIQRLDRLVCFMGCYTVALGFNTMVVIAFGLLNMSW